MLTKTVKTKMLVLVLVALVSGCLAGNLVEEIEKAGATTALSMIQSVGLDTSLMSGKVSTTRSEPDHLCWRGHGDCHHLLTVRPHLLIEAVTER